MTNYLPCLRVLVVDDEPLIRWSISETLNGHGHTVIEAGDAATTVRILTTSPEPIDAVVLDHRLPDSNDLTLLASIRRLAPNSPVVLITAHATPEIFENAFRLGVYGVMNKPFEMEDLAALIVQAWQSRRG